MKVDSWHVRKRDDKGGRWQAVARYKDKSGKWRSKSVMLDDDVTTKRKADKAAAAWVASVEAESGTASSRSTIADYVNAYISKRKMSGVVEASTISTYKTLASRIAKYIGNMRIDKITPDAIYSWQSSMLSDGLSPATVGATAKFMKRVLTSAVKAGDIDKNPMDDVKQPKKQRSMPNSLNISGRTDLCQKLASMPPSPVVTAAAIALFTGMREGEICGLRWNGIDFDSKTINVHSAIGRSNDGAYVKNPKNDSSSWRSIPLTDGLEAFLSARRDEMISQCKTADLPFNDSLFVIGGPGGEFKDPSDISKGWRKLSSSLCLVGTQGRRVTFHDLRHSFATAAIASGIDIKTVSAIIGHSNAAMTLNVYADSLPDTKRAAMDLMDSITSSSEPIQSSDDSAA